MNEEEKKAIERLKEIEVNTYAEGKARTIDTILNLIAKLQKENEEWQRAYQEEKDKQFDFINKISSNDSIPVQKVKDNIEELEEELEIMKVDNMYGRYKEYGGKTKWERLFATKYGIHDALQELLEGRK